MSRPTKTQPDPETATYVRGHGAAAPLGAVIRVEGAHAKPGSFRLVQGSCIVGSAPPCDIIVSEATVSRMHAELHLVPEGVGVTDLGSRNGTFYLGQRVEKMTLGFGGRLEVGAATLVVEPDVGSFSESSFDGESYRGVVGRDPATRRLLGVMQRLEGSLVTVLLEGESGVGKEVFARALHDGSKVAPGPLVVVNCGAIPQELVASELFGHRKGAFTGATDNRRGAFDAADGGTLFLDELGELPTAVQPMLLRVLETGEVRPVGSDEDHRVKVRVVAATNRNLESEVQAGSFREDLFYRLAVVRLRIPPLRERLEDLEPIAQHFAASIGLGSLPPEVIAQLRARSFPGNVRELRNAIQAYSALGVLPEATKQRAGVLDVALRELVDLSRPYAEQKEELNEKFTRVYLESVLAHTHGNQTAAAKLAGLDRSYVGRLVAKYGLGSKPGSGKGS